jgi:hypothetical protein
MPAVLRTPGLDVSANGALPREAVDSVQGLGTGAIRRNDVVGYGAAGHEAHLVRHPRFFHSKM